MSYDLIEATEYDAEPVELFEFTRGSFVWRFTSSDSDKLVGGQTYTDQTMKAPAINSSQDIAKAPVTINATVKNPFVIQYFAGSPSDTIEVSIKQYHESDIASQVVTIWNGRVTNVKFKGAKCDIRCEPETTTMNRTTLRRRYQPECPHLLYGADCGLNREDFEVVAEVTATTGSTVTADEIAAQGDGYFDGGYLEWLRSGYSDRRTILSHTGGTITLNGTISDLEVGDSVKVYPGCGHNMTACKDKFSNIENYGGFPWLSARMKNPMGGDTVF